MKNRIVTTIPLVLLLLLAGFLVYLNNVFLPIKVKAIVVQRLSDYLDKKVEIGRLKYDLFKGIVIENAAIFEGSKDEKKYYLKIDRAFGNFLILPILKNRKIIVPVLHIESPQIFLTRKKDKVLNFADFFKKPPAPKIKSRYTFIIYKIIVSSGSCSFRDESLSPAFEGKITDLKLGAEFNLPAKISFLVEGKISRDKSDITPTLSFSGKYNPLGKELDSNLILSKVPLIEYLDYIKDLPVSLSLGYIDYSNLKIKLLIDKEIGIKGEIITKGIQFTKDKYAFKGNLNIYPDLKYTFRSRKFIYSGIFKLSEVTFSGLGLIKDIRDIKGDITLEENKLFSDNLEVKVLDNFLSVKAILENFLNPYLKLNISAATLDLAKLIPLFPGFPSNVTLNGNTTLNMDVRGYLRKFPSEINATSQIISAALSAPYLEEPLSELKGKIGFTLNELNWENLAFLYKDKPFRSSGKLINFRFPQIDFVLVSEDLNLEALLYIREKIIKINDFSGKYLDSEFNFKGNINTEDSHNPALEISLKSDLALKDAVRLVPDNLKQKIEKISLDGICKLSGSLTGKIKDIKDWNTLLNVSSPSLSLYGLKLENLRFRINQKNRYLLMENLSAKFYNGNLNANLDSNLNAQIPLYDTKISLSDVDLSLLKVDTNMKDKNIAGLLSTEANLQTDAKDLASLNGKGYISIKDGRLWDLNLLKGLGKLLLLPIYEQIVFKKAYGNFTIKDQALHTDDLFLGSRSVDMLCRGKVDFKGNIDLTMNTEILPDLLIDSADLRKFTSPIFGNLLTIKVSGTIQKPKYKTSIITKEIFKEIKRFFLGR